MLETTPIVTGGVLYGGLRTCQPQHTLLSVLTLPPPALAQPFLALVCLFLPAVLFCLHLTNFNMILSLSLREYFCFVDCGLARKVAVSRNSHVRKHFPITTFQTQSDGKKAVYSYEVWTC